MRDRPSRPIWATYPRREDGCLASPSSGARAIPSCGFLTPVSVPAIAGTETGVRNPHDGMALAPEDGDARHPSSLRGYVAHIGREGRSRMTHHREFPAAALGEFLLDSGPVGARRREGRPGDHVLMDAVVAVGPQGAVRAGDTHIVNEDEILVMTEELRQAHRAVDVGELVVLDLLRLDGGERLSHLLPNCGDLPAIVRELSVHIRVFHRCVLQLPPH